MFVSNTTLIIACRYQNSAAKPQTNESSIIQHHTENRKKSEEQRKAILESIRLPKFLPRNYFRPSNGASSKACYGQIFASKTRYSSSRNKKQTKKQTKKTDKNKQKH